MMRNGKAVSRKTLNKKETNPKKFVTDVSDDEERTTGKDKKKLRQMWEFQGEEQQEQVAEEGCVKAGPRRRLQLKDETTDEEADTQQENQEKEVAEEEDDPKTMRERMRLETKRKVKASAKPKKRQRLIPSALKGVAIKKPTQVPFSQQDLSLKPSDREDHEEAEEKKPYLTKERIHVTEQVMRKEVHVRK